jgi:predicted DNA-binding ribbon-helix-helix protein
MSHQYLKKPALLKRSINLSGHATSISIENAFWDALHDISKEKKISMNALINFIDRQREGNLSSAIRLYILHFMQKRIHELEEGQK